MDVNVKTVELTVKTAKLTKALLKQLPMLHMEQIRPLLQEDGNEKPEHVLGWVHGSVLGDDYKKWLILKLPNGSYGRYDAMTSTCNKYQQIYIV